MNESCLFCKIISGKIPSAKVYEDENFFCIKDISPQAKVHLLLLPKKHFPSLAEAFPENGNQEVELIGKLFERAYSIAKEQGLLPDGFRTVINTSRNAGQTVDHLHLHILGGEMLSGFGA